MAYIESFFYYWLFAVMGYKYAGENKQNNDLNSLLIMSASKRTIIDNEVKTPLEVSVSDARLDESSAMMCFTVPLTGMFENGERLSVVFQTANIIVTVSYDYASTLKTVTSTKDSMTQTIEVLIYDDSYKEHNESMNNIDFKYRKVA